MTDMASREDDRREEAARWFARMRRPDADQFRTEFDQWLAEPEHLAVYNRIAERFSDAKILRQAAPVTARRKLGSQSTLQLAGLFAAALLGAIIVLMAIEAFRPGTLPTLGHGDRDGARIAFETTRGEIRSMRLADGSIVTLDAESLLTVAFTGTSRNLRLERGRVRFDIAQDSRPFTAYAAAAKVVSAGATFDIAVAPERQVQVSVVEGAVDLTSSLEQGKVNSRKLVAGTAVMVGEQAAIASISYASSQPEWPQGIAEYDKVPLGKVIAQAQLHTQLRLRLADPKLASLAVSGRFRVDRPEALVDNIAHIFGLVVDRSKAGELVLRAP